MVAYSFKSGFVPLIQSGAKRQTIRAHRKRHARPGEMLQLYTAMRTKQCRKIIPDVRCVAVDEIIMPAGCWTNKGDYDPILINGIPVLLDDLEAFARADGFQAEQSHTAAHEMRTFWRLYHGLGRFEGVVIRWEADHE